MAWDGASTSNDTTSVRQLADGTRFAIVKIFREPDDLALALAGEGLVGVDGGDRSSFTWAHGRGGRAVSGPVDLVVRGAEVGRHHGRSPDGSFPAVGSR